jgi:ATP adenylyltransferase/5',5'''-P-1,P-4-tetraphosphate phosphorylase II
MIQKKVNQLFKEQLTEWALAKNNYKALERVKVKTLDVNGSPYKVQFNPARIASVTARIDSKSILERKCFLCLENRPPEQRGIPFKGRYTILVNPYPIFPRHLTIPTVEHTPQLIAFRFDDMLDLAQQLDDYIIFYNGSKCGASAPDHFHFQAGNKGFLPIENDRNRHNAIHFESANKQDILNHFEQVCNTLPLSPNEAEPRLNILIWYENRQWITCLFPRTKHRPACYLAEGDANLLISPSSVEMGGVYVTCLEKDFERITAENIADIIHEVSQKHPQQ